MDVGILSTDCEIVTHNSEVFFISVAVENAYHSTTASITAVN